MHIDKLIRRKGSRIVYKDRVLGGNTPASLALKDRVSVAPPWDSLSIQSSDLIFVRHPYVNGIERIAYETEPNRFNAWRSLKTQIKQAKETRRLLKSMISRAAYNRVVQFYTRGTKWINGSVIGFRKDRQLRTTNTLTPLYQERVLSKKEFLELLTDPVKTPGLPRRVRRQATIALDSIVSNPEWDDDMYYLWREVVGYSASSAVTGHVFFNMIPIFAKKKIFLRDWGRIRESWLRLRRQVQERVDANDEHLLRLRKEEKRLSYRNTSKWNKMWQIGDIADLEPMDGTMPSYDSSAFVPFYGAFAGSSGMLSLHTLAHDDPWFSHVSTGFINHEMLRPGMSPQAVYEVIESVPKVAAVQALIPWCYTAINERLCQYSHLHKVVDGQVAQKIMDYTEGELYTQRTSQESLSYYMGTLPAPTIIDLDKLDGFDPEVDFEEKRLLKIKQLLALDIGTHADDINFNLARSVGELKDSKDTLQSGRAFLAWARAVRRGTPYYEVVMEKGAGSVRYALPGGRDSTSILVASVHRGLGGKTVLRSKSLRKAGILKVFVRQITPLTAAAQLASLYLSWKFGVSQTLADTNTVLSNGWKWATTVRRGLHQLALHLDTAREYHTLRRMWRTRSPKLPRRIKTESYMETVESASQDTLEFNDTLDFMPSYRALNGDLSGQMHIPGNERWLIVESELGFWYPDPVTNVKGPDVSDVYEYRRAIKEHNDALIARLLLDRNWGGCVYFRNDMRGVVFAKFTWKAILRGLRRGLTNLHASLKSFTTAWELAPLSFIVEWVLNVRTLVDSAQALLERSELKIFPVGKPWEMLSTRLWVGTQSASITGVVNWRVNNVGTAIVQSTTGDADLQIKTSWATSVVTHVGLTYSFSRKTHKGVLMRKTNIRKAVRRPFAGDHDELPPVRVKLNLNTGKLGSLLAMLTSRLK